MTQLQSNKTRDTIEWVTFIFIITRTHCHSEKYKLLDVFQVEKKKTSSLRPTELDKWLIIGHCVKMSVNKLVYFDQQWTLVLLKAFKKCTQNHSLLNMNMNWIKGSKWMDKPDLSLWICFYIWKRDRDNVRIDQMSAW